MSLACVSEGRPVREPLNLGGGWLDFDYEKTFGKPVRFINDAAMHERWLVIPPAEMLFLGFGTSIGATVIVDDVILPFEIGMLRLTRRVHFMDRLCKEAYNRDGRERWLRSAYEAIEMMRDVFKPDDIVLGGGNAPQIDPLPKGCRFRDNQAAFAGATRLWPGADMIAEPHGTSWRIHRKRRKGSAKAK